jgi:hypothetical protein
MQKIGGISGTAKKATGNFHKENRGEQSNTKGKPHATQKTQIIQSTIFPNTCNSKPKKKKKKEIHH